jgi:hypothetical protein
MHEWCEKNADKPRCAAMKDKSSDVEDESDGSN